MCQGPNWLALQLFRTCNIRCQLAAKVKTFGIPPSLLSPTHYPNIFLPQLTNPRKCCDLFTIFFFPTSFYLLLALTSFTSGFPVRWPHTLELCEEEKHTNSNKIDAANVSAIWAFMLVHWYFRSYHVWRTRMVDPGYRWKEGGACSRIRWKFCFLQLFENAIFCNSHNSCNQRNLEDRDQGCTLNTIGPEHSHQWASLPLPVQLHHLRWWWWLC